MNEGEGMSGEKSIGRMTVKFELDRNMDSTDVTVLIYLIIGSSASVETVFGNIATISYSVILGLGEEMNKEELLQQTTNKFEAMLFAVKSSTISDTEKA